MAGRLEEELKAIQEELDSLDFLAPRDVNFTPEEEAYSNEMFDAWLEGKPWDPESVPDIPLVPDPPPGGGTGLTLREWLVVFWEMLEEGFYDAELFAPEDDG